MYVLDVRWSKVAERVVVYAFERLPFRSNITQAYEAADPLDESVEAHATHVLAAYLRQFEAVEAFEFDGRELTLKGRAGAGLEVLHDLAVNSLGYAIGCEISLSPAES